MKGDIDKRIADLRAALDGARSVPMSASVMFNRSEFSALIDLLEQAVDDTLVEASEVVEDRDAFVDTGRLEAIEILREAERQQADLVSDTDVFRLAQDKAAETEEAARTAAEALRLETEQYVEAKLANFEHTLEKARDQVRRGRAELAAGRATEGIDALGAAELRAETDEYVDGRLAGFEETLEQARELVVRGRAQLAGGHVHGLGDDSDVGDITLSEHLDRG